MHCIQCNLQQSGRLCSKARSALTTAPCNENRKKIVVVVVVVVIVVVVLVVAVVVRKELGLINS